MKQLILVFIGGGSGSIARFLLGKWLNNSITGIPYGTFLANILGSLLIGLILGYLAKSENLGRARRMEDAIGRYSEFVKVMYKKTAFIFLKAVFIILIRK